MDKRLTRFPVVFGFLGTLLVWSAVFALMIVPQHLRIVSKDSVRVILQTEPVDPFDLMRGEYVTLSYPRLQPDEAFMDAARIGETIYVVLETQASGQSEAIDFVRQKPVDRLFLRGTIRDTGWQKQLAFGLENYFVSQGIGPELEKLRNERRLQIEAAINPKSGKATITGILIDDQPIKTNDQLQSL